MGEPGSAGSAEEKRLYGEGLSGRSRTSDFQVAAVGITAQPVNGPRLGFAWFGKREERLRLSDQWIYPAVISKSSFAEVKVLLSVSGIRLHLGEKKRAYAVQLLETSEHQDLLTINSIIILYE